MIRVIRAAGLLGLSVFLCGGIQVNHPHRSDPAVEVLEVALAAGVSQRQPQGQFSPQGSCQQGEQAQMPRIDPARHAAVVLWTRVKSAARQELRHTYYRAAPQPERRESDWEEVAAVSLSIGRSTGWRTWSEKTLGQGLEGAWKIEITSPERPDAVLCAVQFFVLSDAVWQALTAERHVQDLLCRMAQTSSAETLFRAGEEVLKSRDGAEGEGAMAPLLSAWDRFMQHAASSDRLFCLDDA